MWTGNSKANRKGSADSTNSRMTAIVNNLLQFRTSRIQIEDLSQNDVIVA